MKSAVTSNGDAIAMPTRHRYLPPSRYCAAATVPSTKPDPIHTIATGNEISASVPPIVSTQSERLATVALFADAAANAASEKMAKKKARSLEPRSAFASSAPSGWAATGLVFVDLLMRGPPYSFS